MINVSLKNNKTILSGKRRTVKLRNRLIEDKHLLLHKRSYAQMLRELTYGMDEVRQTTLVVFKLKLHTLIQNRILRRHLYDSEKDQDIANMNNNNNYQEVMAAEIAFPNYYDVHAMYDLCDDFREMNSFVRRPQFKLSEFIPAVIIKQYIVYDRRYDYTQDKYVKALTSKEAAVKFKSDYLFCLELIKENYIEDNPSRLAPDIFYHYIKYNKLFEGHIARGDQALFENLLDNLANNNYDEQNALLKVVLGQMQFHTWYDYLIDKWVIYYDAIGLVLEYVDNMNGYLYYFITASVYFITAFVTDLFRYNRFHLGIEKDKKFFIESLLQLVGAIQYEYIKFRYLFFGEDFSSRNGFVRSNRPIVSYCSGIHGKDIMLGYLAYKYCYDRAKSDVEERQNQ